MGTSLRDQLFKAGLIDEKKIRQAKAEEHKKAKQKKHHAPADANEAKRAAQQALAQKAEHDRILDRERKAAAQRKELMAQIKQLVAAHGLTRPGDDLPYHFVDGNFVRTIQVGAAVHEQLRKNFAVIVKAEEKYDVVPADIAEKIRQRDTTCVILPDEKRHDAEDDAYSAYKIPDDLIW